MIIVMVMLVVVASVRVIATIITMLFRSSNVQGMQQSHSDHIGPLPGSPGAGLSPFPDLKCSTFLEWDLFLQVSTMSQKEMTGRSITRIFETPDPSCPFTFNSCPFLVVSEQYPTLPSPLKYLPHPQGGTHEPVLVSAN